MEIPYYNPVKRKWTVYVPDLVVVLEDGKGHQHTEMIEIKPLSQTPGYQKLSEKTGKPLRLSRLEQIAQLENQAKWAAAMAFCKKHGWKFQVMTEQTMFGVRK